MIFESQSSKREQYLEGVAMSRWDNIIYIKNMVCDRCCMVVSEVFVSLGLEPVHVELGKVELEEPPEIDLNEIDFRLQEKGFEILQDADEQLVDQIKTHLIEYVKISETDSKQKLSGYLQKNLHRDYSSLSKIFSKTEDITIERYLILLRIERVKELISYGQMTLSDIAFRLGYSSTQHLSAQFREVTGMTVTDYKKMRESLRKSLDRLPEKD